MLLLLLLLLLKRRLVLVLTFEHEMDPLLRDLSALLVDMELLHDYCTLITYEDYVDYEFGPRFWYRARPRVAPEHMLRAARVIKQSPLTIELLISATGGAFLLIQCMEKVRNWKLNRRKLELEVSKLVYEGNLLKLEEERRALEVRASARLNETVSVLERLLGRLETSSFKLTDCRIELTTYLASEDKGDPHSASD